MVTVAMPTTPHQFMSNNNDNNDYNVPFLINNLFDVLNINFNTFSDNVPSEPYMNRFKKAFCDLVISNYTNTDYIVIDGLNNEERHFFYKNISELGLKFSKYNYDYTPRTKVITVHFPRETKIPNFATYNGVNRYTNIKPQIIRYCDFVKNTLDTHLSSQLNIRSPHIPATIQQYLTYNAISFYSNTQRPPTLTPPPIVRGPHITRGTTFVVNGSNRNQHNSKIRLDLADLIFDIKDKITDSEFIDIMQKISQIKTS